MRLPRAYDATITREDFLRLLPEATGQTDISEDEGWFRGTGWSLRLTPIAPLEIGIVRLARHRVEIEFDAMDEAARDAFMRRFTLAYQRGGG